MSHPRESEFRLVNDPERPGLNSHGRGYGRKSKLLNAEDTQTAAERDAQLKQLKLIKTHMEVLTGEELELSQNDDDNGGTR